MQPALPNDEKAASGVLSDATDDLPHPTFVRYIEALAG
jgi:hypothetical protein